MVKKHMKRISAPRSWPILRKNNTFIKRPNPGAHKFIESMPLGIILTEILGIAKTAKEASYLLNKGGVLVDKKIRKDPKVPVGLMDTISIPKIEKHYRVVLNKKGKISVVEISEEESRQKLVKITGKTILKSGKVQLNFSGSRNMLVDKDEYKRGYVLLVELPSQKVKDVFKLEKGATVFLKSGSHVGDVAKVESFTSTTIMLKPSKGDVYETKRVNQMVVGKDKPVIKLNI